MLTQPIVTTARTPVEYIPIPQDAEAYARGKQKEIDALERDLALVEEERRAEEFRLNQGKPDSMRVTAPETATSAALKEEIAEARRFMSRTIDTIRATYPNPQVFTIKIPTAVEREMINSRLIQLGLRQVSQEIMRATMIEELFHEDWGKGSPEANEAHAEDLANFLDGAWQRQEAHEVAVARWQEQEVQRVLDEANGAPPRPREELPPKILTVRETAKLSMTVERMVQNSQALRNLSAEIADFNRLNGLLLIRAHVRAATNVKTVLTIDPLTDALPTEQALALREEIDDTSWHDLVGYIDRLYSVDGYEEKNSDSPLGKPSDQTGLNEPIGDTATSDGTWTNSSISAAPAEESVTIIAPSSPSISGQEPEAIPVQNYSPTAEA